MIPESLTKYFSVYQIGAEEQAKYVKEFQTNGYLKIGGSAWGDNSVVNVKVSTTVNVNILDTESA